MSTFGQQNAVPAVIQRGGTSRGVYFHTRDMPPHGPRRDALLTRLMGSPDVVQIDGLGGSRPITSKIAIIEASDRPDADVDYTFGQVKIAEPGVDWAGNCGNISSGVGAFAVDEGLVEAVEPVTTVRIFNTNTRAILVAQVPVVDGKSAVLGDFSIPGVPGTGAEIVMNWAGTIGAVTGTLLPTGRPRDEITLDDGSTVGATLCDAGNPSVWVPAADAGLSGSELTELNDPKILARVREIRGRAAQLLGFCDDWHDADSTTAVLPLIGFVAPPASYTTLNGAHVDEAEMDLRLRVIFMQQLHESTPGTGSISLAAASRIPDTTVYDAVADHERDELRIGHPSGVTPTKVKAVRVDGDPGVEFELLGFGRTSRRIMDSTAYVPVDTLDDVPETEVDDPSHGVVSDDTPGTR
ncbi:PrpF protein [Mycolicibacterium sp. 018/SC-01/001]|uniref:2-methylaconitate cis-trans isomerase PrpF family protein n=1 Tax=Mycolicibacterium sp. 018/SC-01/001 TaxID=2592069 RepID=UPI00117CA6E2|nr:PrpF domain-containing protein [Mycolicibacterium sp. 018/SC-01/001]TRW79863.1 PrpF protein [Mycolicibacterium sp. 018/SC-01/001]